MLRIGLTGGIGSGKSAVSRLFAERGIPVIDADVIARELLAPDAPATQEVLDEFGDEIRDPMTGGLDRKALRRLVFANIQARHRLETLLHPKIRAEMNRQQTGLGSPYCIMSIPLLVESGLRETVDRVLVVDCPEALQVERTMSRDGISRDDALAILAAQASRAQRLALADDVIDNSGDLVALEAQVETLHRHYLELARNGG
ncbi:dephospho-CoA kinase [Thioalkalivibrio sulfidiphilus]|uniref:dephospho-CoA kinase n=1 Tax=Thioalkalivibrio sulfidiphilus TaxID=1033854 RepID=UPI003BB1B945